jgi:hypothetical protein
MPDQAMNNPRERARRRFRGPKILILMALAVSACSSDDPRPDCDPVYAAHYGRMLMRASEDPAEPWRRAGYHSPAAWAHARASAAVSSERQAQRCR